MNYEFTRAKLAIERRAKIKRVGLSLSIAVAAAALHAFLSGSSSFADASTSIIVGSVVGAGAFYFFA